MIIWVVEKQIAINVFSLHTCRVYWFKEKQKRVNYGGKS